MINYYIALKKNFQNSLYETWLKNSWLSTVDDSLTKGVQPAWSLVLGSAPSPSNFFTVSRQPWERKKDALVTSQK